MSGRMPGDCGDVCSTIAMAAGKSAGRFATTSRSASMPPADVPMTTTCWGGIPSYTTLRTRAPMADGTTDELEPEQQAQQHRRPHGPAMVVGIGASAGGIAALSQFF